MHQGDPQSPISAPPTTAQRVEAFPVPVAGFIAQPHLELMPLASEWSSGNGEGVLTERSVTLSYTFWRNPSNRDDPSNLRDLDEATKAALAAPPVRQLAPQLEEARQRGRFPMVWDAIRTTIVGGGEDLPDLGTALIDHATYILMNTFRDTRTAAINADPSSHPCTVDGAPRTEHLQPAPFELDAVTYSGLLLDTDPDVWAGGIALADRLITVVVERALLDSLDLRYTTVRPS